MKLKYYIRNLVGSFIGLCALSSLVINIFKYIAEPYENIAIILSTMIMLIGLILVGYVNAKTALGNKIKESSYLHCILVFFLFVTDLTLSPFDLFISVILRNVGYFIALQFGVYLFKKINIKKISLKN